MLALIYQHQPDPPRVPFDVPWSSQTCSARWYIQLSLPRIAENRRRQTFDVEEKHQKWSPSPSPSHHHFLVGGMVTIGYHSQENGWCKCMIVYDCFTHRGGQLPLQTEPYEIVGEARIPFVTVEVVRKHPVYNNMSHHSERQQKQETHQFRVEVNNNSEFHP